MRGKDLCSRKGCFLCAKGKVGRKVGGWVGRGRGVSQGRRQKKKFLRTMSKMGGGLKIFLSKCPNLFVFGNEVLNF